MIKSKLVKLFIKLDLKQKRQFRKWLISPIHNQHQDVILLFDFLYSKRKITPTSISKKKAFSYIYPKAAYNDNRLRHVMNFASNTLNKFVRYSLQENDTFNTDFSLIKAYADLELEQYCLQEIHQAKQKLTQSTVQNSDFFLQQYNLEQALFAQTGMKRRTGDTNLQAITTSFTTFFIINTLKYACISQTHSNLRKENYQIPLLAAVLEEVQQGGYEAIDTVMMYYHSYWALTKEQAPEHFLQLKKYLFAPLTSLSKEDHKELYLAALNYCIKQLNSRDETYVIEALNIYKMGLKTKLLLEDDKLSRFTYKNIVALALRAQQFDWAETFIKRYAPYIDITYRESYLHYNSCKLYYERGDYNRALLGLKQVEFDDIFLNLDAKVLLLKIYFANESSNALASLLDSFSVFLNRKSREVMSYHLLNYRNIIRLARKLMNCNKNDREEILQLKRQIEETSPLTERKWLLQSL